MAAEEQSTLIDVTNINEKVYNYIKTNIISYNYPPGYNLNLNQLSELLGVSPTPIKDALFRLAGEGLVEIAPRKGTYVKDVTSRISTRSFRSASSWRRPPWRPSPRP